jgi:hypothetical protein
MASKKATMAMVTMRQQRRGFSSARAFRREESENQEMRVSGVMVQDVDGCALGSVAGGGGGAPGAAVGDERFGDLACAAHCLPISTPIRKSRMQSNTTQLAAMATIREVMVKTYWVMGVRESFQ